MNSTSSTKMILRKIFYKHFVVFIRGFLVVSVNLHQLYTCLYHLHSLLVFSQNSVKNSAASKPSSGLDHTVPFRRTSEATTPNLRTLGALVGLHVSMVGGEEALPNV